MNRTEKIQDCVSRYGQLLCDKNYLYVYGSEESPKTVEVTFQKENVMHLLHIKLNNLSVEDFYQRCYNNGLSIRDYNIQKDTDEKIENFNAVLNIGKASQMLGDFDSFRIKLKTDKIVGNVFQCVGFVKFNNRFYVPNTSLSGDIRDFSSCPEKILLTFEKNIKEQKYKKIIHKGKNVNEDAVRKLISQYLE